MTALQIIVHLDISELSLRAKGRVYYMLIEDHGDF